MSALQAIGILAVVAFLVGVLWTIRPGAAVRVARRSIQLGFPLALGIALTAPPIPELKPRSTAEPIMTRVAGTIFHATCFYRPEAEILPCLEEVDRILARLQLRGKVR